MAFMGTAMLPVNELLKNKLYTNQIILKNYRNQTCIFAGWCSGF